MERKNQKVQMTLEGESGNAFDLLARFKNHAKRLGWPLADIEAVLTEARSGDYDHLLLTLMAHVEQPDEGK
jgi:hypothetical protein